MRMRKKKHGAERLAANARYLLERPETPLADPSALFGREAPTYLEIGCGKGGFASGMAEKYPGRNFLALEKISDVMVIAVEGAEARREAREADNLRFFIADAHDLPLWFAPASLDGIYLNFSDPWPKKKHAKRRLTYREMLTMYFGLLKPGAPIRFKTDNRPLFDFTLEELEAVGAKPHDVTYDLHASPENADNVETEYEKNFSAKGFSICALEVTAPEVLTAPAPTVPGEGTPAARPIAQDGAEP